MYKLKPLANSQMEQEARKQIYAIFLQYVPEFQALAENQVKKSYAGYFVRDPVDTGNARENTSAIIEAQLRPEPILRAIFEIDQAQVNYALFFAEPLQKRNPNFKYGRRNTAISSRDQFAKALGIKTN